MGIHIMHSTCVCGLEVTGINQATRSTVYTSDIYCLTVIGATFHIQLTANMLHRHVDPNTFTSICQNITKSNPLLNMLLLNTC